MLRWWKCDNKRLCAMKHCTINRWPSQDSGQTAIMSRMIQVFTVFTCHRVFFSCCSSYVPSYYPDLTLVLLNKLRCHTYIQFSANQITWSSLLIHVHILNVKQCRSRSVGFFRSQLIWIYTVCKDRVYPGSAGLGLTINLQISWYL